jgi:hypothetical protein
MRSDTVVLLPSANRPHNLERCLDSAIGEADVYISVMLDDERSGDIAWGCGKVTQYFTRSQQEYEYGAVYAWNQLLSFAPHYDNYVLGADDLIFEAGWLAAAKRALTYIGGHGIVALNDGNDTGDIYAAHWLTTKMFIDTQLGGVMYPPMYKSWWCDREISDIAKAQNKYIYARDAVVKHKHYSFGTAPIDETYTDAMRNYQADEVTYLTRKAQGFPRWENI